MVNVGSPRDTFAYMPSRELLLIIDPRCVPTLLESANLQALRLVSDLRSVEIPVTIHLLLPTHLTDKATIPLANKIAPPLSVTTDSSFPPFKLKEDIRPQDSKHLLAGTEESNRSLSLLAVANAVQADGIVTDEQILIDARYTLYQHHRVRVIPLREFGDTVEIFSHGHSIFWPASSSERYITFDLFYQWYHWKNARIAKWFNKVGEEIKCQELKEGLRSALLNRYPFLLYSRDMIRFYELQMDFYARRGLKRRFSMGVGFYVTTFYLLLWGMLDHLTVIAKWARDLKIDEKHCGIRSKKFWKEFRTKEPKLDRFLKHSRFSKWISMMADMRHTAAHRTMALPTQVLEKTEESKKSDEDIIEIIRAERSQMYKVLPAHVMKSMEPMMINLWRIDKMKEIAPSMVYIKGEKEAYLWDPVVSIDHDLQYLTAIMDAFLVTLFR